MKPLFSAQSFTAALVVGVFALMTPAHARSEVFFSIGVQIPGVYVQPAPVYVQPAPVYVQPAPVYVRPAPVYVRPAPVYVQPRLFYTPAPGYYQRHDHDRRYKWQHWDRRGPYGGHVMNKFPHDRDGDGAYNRYDRQPDNPYRR